MKVSPITLPCIMPITWRRGARRQRRGFGARAAAAGRASRLPPERQCIVIFTSASAEMRTLRAAASARATRAHNAAVSAPRCCCGDALFEEVRVVAPRLLLVDGALQLRVVAKQRLGLGV